MLMKTKYRIDWKSGMRLSDAVFQASDEFHLAQQTPLYTLMLRGGYGHLVEPRFRYEVDNETLSVIEMACVALSPSGRLLSLRFDHNERELFQSLAMPATYEPFIVYLDASSSGHVSFTEGDIPYRDIDYRLTFKSEATAYNNPDAVPIARFVYDHCWSVDTGFIPPCVSLKANSDLWQLAFGYVKALKELIAALRGKVVSQMETAVCALLPTLCATAVGVEKELDEMSPKHLVTCMQRTISGVCELCSVVPECQVPDPEACQAYIQGNYQAHRIAMQVQEGIRLTRLLTGMVGEFPDKPPVPQPQPEPLPHKPVVVEHGAPDSKRFSWKNRTKKS